MKALICCGVKSLPSMLVFQSVPMWRFTERMVRSALVTACRLATSPTRTSPFLANATTDGVVRDPSALAMTVGSPPSRTLTTELVVPRSMPTARAMSVLLLLARLWVESVGRNFIVSSGNGQRRGGYSQTAVSPRAGWPRGSRVCFLRGRCLCLAAGDAVTRTRARVTGVVASAALHRVRPDTAVQCVVPLVAEDGVIAVTAGQRVVAGVSDDEVLSVTTVDRVVARRTAQDVVAGGGTGAAVRERRDRLVRVPREEAHIGRDGVAAAGGPVRRAVRRAPIVVS